MIRVCAVDDHSLFRQTIRSMVEQSGELDFVGEGSCGSDVFDLVEVLRPDVLLLDLNMPDKRDGSGKFHPVHAIQKLGKQIPETRIIALTHEDDSLTVQFVLEAGARGYFLKSDDLRLLAPAIKLVSETEQEYLSPSVAKLGSESAPDEA